MASGVEVTKAPPCNIDAERSVLGSMLLDGQKGFIDTIDRINVTVSLEFRDQLLDNRPRFLQGGLLHCRHHTPSGWGQVFRAKTLDFFDLFFRAVRMYWLLGVQGAALILWLPLMSSQMHEN